MTTDKRIEVEFFVSMPMQTMSTLTHFWTVSRRWWPRLRNIVCKGKQKYIGNGKQKCILEGKQKYTIES